jgi:hypothetical protein
VDWSNSKWVSKRVDSNGREQNQMAGSRLE